MRAFQHAPAFGFRFQHASGLRPSLVSISAFYTPGSPCRARGTAINGGRILRAWQGYGTTG